MISQFSFLVILLVLSGLFSSTETAFTSLSIIQIHDMEEKHRRRGKRVAKLMEKPQILLTTLLIGNNLVNIGATALATALTIRLFGSAFVGLMTGLLTFFVLIFGEVSPKQIALARNEEISLFMALPIELLSYLFRPVIWVVSGISFWIVKPFVGSNEKSFTLDNLLQMVSLGKNMGIVESYEQQMVKNVFRINDTPVKGIMTHRTDVFCLDKESSVEEVLDKILDSGFSRVPLYRENPENIEGLLLVRTVLTALSRGEGGGKLKDYMMAAFFIPETKMVHDLFLQFKKKKLGMAIVLDEYGGLSGIVTKEDVVEEIFGELYDENEKPGDEKIQAIEEQGWIIKGDSSFYEIHDYLNLELIHDPQILTISGYLIEKLGEIPREGTIIELPEGNYTIAKVANNRIEEIRFHKKQPVL